MVKQKTNGHANKQSLPFSVEDDEEDTRPTTSDSRHGLLSNGDATNRTITSTARPTNDNHRYGGSKWRASDSNKNKFNENRDDLRLTDEIELNGDSDSDDLDLLPPLPSKHSTSKVQKRLQKIFFCCPNGIGRITPPKCTIM